jgi:hypothetical protein
VEDQLGALSLVDNVLALLTTRYDRAATQLRASSATVNDEDIARLTSWKSTM